MKHEQDRVQLGVDGNQGFALLGDNIQTGEAEFSEINYSETDANGKIIAASFAERKAATRAFSKLKDRLKKPEMSFTSGSLTHLAIKNA